MNLPSFLRERAFRAGAYLTSHERFSKPASKNVSFPFVHRSICSPWKCAAQQWDERHRLRTRLGATRTPSHSDPDSHLRLYLARSEEHTSELQSPYVISYAVFCLKKK